MMVGLQTCVAMHLMQFDFSLCILLAPGLKAIMESIDNRSDFRTFMQNYAFAHGGNNARGPKRNGPRDEGYVRLNFVSHLAAFDVGYISIYVSQLPPILPHHPTSSPSTMHSRIPDRGRPTFGVDLAEQMIRDDVDVPPIMLKCCEAIERYGLQSQGIYRISGTMSKITKLKELLDRGQSSSSTVYCGCRYTRGNR